LRNGGTILTEGLKPTLEKQASIGRLSVTLHLPWLLGCGAFDCAVSPRFVGARSFGFVLIAAVELDAIEPNQLRALVQETIERHLPALKAAERSERDVIMRLVGEKLHARRRGEPN
jgi:hypothetical protein